ncbi:MAG: LamG domain-containing protein [Planctomycetota bacterium]|jgi:hypothetical protein
MCKKLICLVSFVLVLGLALTSVVEAATDLVGHWKFDEGSGNIAKDSSGNGHDGTFNGNPQWVEGQLGGALDFDGDDSVEIPHHPSLSITDEITVTAWAKIRAGAGGELAIISKGGWAANDLPFELTQVPGGPTCWQFYDDGGRDMCNPPTLPEEEWHHIAGTYDGQSFKIYYDGVLEEEVAYVGTMPENTASVTIGQRSRGGTFYDGTIDEVAIYNRALSEDEIAATMMGLSDARLASEPTPTDEATDVPRDVTLSWTPGEFAPAVNGHIVYLSENFNDVNDGIGGITQSAGSYAPPQRLDLDTTYYWRVDEVNAPPDSRSGLTDDLHSTVIQTMWASAFGAPQPTWIEFEFDRLYVHHEMWAWNSNTELESAIGYGFQDVTVEYSLDGVEFATLGSTHEFARAPGADGYAHNTAIDFGGVQAKYVKLTVNTNWALFPFPQFGLSEVRFLHSRRCGPELESRKTGCRAQRIRQHRRAGGNRRHRASHDLDRGKPQSIIARTGHHLLLADRRGQRRRDPRDVAGRGPELHNAGVHCRGRLRVLQRH